MSNTDFPFIESTIIKEIYWTCEKINKTFFNKLKIYNYRLERLGRFSNNKFEQWKDENQKHFFKFAWNGFAISQIGSHTVSSSKSSQDQFILP